MFSKEYFSYLFKSKKYLLLIILLITLLNVFGNQEIKVALCIEAVICGMLCYFLPVYIFSFIHNKKAVDTFFSIPVSRKATLISGILFCILTVYIPLALTLVFYGFVEKIGLVVFVYLLELLLIVSTLLVFNTTIYLTANNVFDGVVMIGAYSFLPLVLYICINNIISTYVAGLYSMDLPFLAYFSPVVMSGNIFIEVLNKGHDIKHLIALLVYLVVFSIILLKAYTNRDVERADTPSSKFFAYPLIILIYVALSLFVISSQYGYSYKNILEFLKENFILYVLLFAIYVAAHFIYKRKLYFNYKLPLFYVLALILSLVVAVAFKSSQGFGLAQRYNHHDNYARYDLYSWNNITSKDILKLIEEKEDHEAEDVSLSIVGPGNYDRNNLHKIKLNDETVDLFEEIRQEAIKQYYVYVDPHEYNPYKANLTITHKGQQSYSYSFDLDISYETLCKFAKDKNINVYISTNEASYVLNSNGELVSLNNEAVEIK